MKLNPVAFAESTISAQEADPSTSAHGVDCSKLEEVVVSLYDPSGMAAGTTLEIWVSADGTTWHQSDSDTVTIDHTVEDTYGPYDVACFRRFAAVLKNGSWAGSIKKRLTGR